MPYPHNSELSFNNLRVVDDVAALLGTTGKQLRFLLYGLNDQGRYVTFQLTKRSGKKRIIHAPRAELKFLQRELASWLAKVYQPPRCVRGFTDGESIVTNASAHTKPRYVFNVDLKDFFPTINFGRVRGLFLSQPFIFNKTVATVLAQLCCNENAIPQGAPTSPILSNMICRRLDRELKNLAKKNRCVYTRYADDITFSIRRSDFPESIGFLQDGIATVGNELKSIIEDNGFRINTDKVHLHSNKMRQRVTGLVINSGKPNVPRRFVRQIRAMIHACRKHGIEAANREHSERFYRRQLKRDAKPLILDVIQGKIEFLKSVKGIHDPVLKNLQRQFVDIAPEYFDVMKKQNDQVESRDFFISHASEDKQEIAKPLADALIRKGVTVWYDEYEILVGQSIRQRVDEGLRVSRFGVVVLSEHFFSKSWPQWELDGLYALEGGGAVRILPVLHGIHLERVKQFSPMLAGRKVATGSVVEIVNQLSRHL